MSKQQGIIIETNDGGDVKTMVFGWGAFALGIGVAVSAVILSSSLGIALTILSVGAGIALISTGIGEGVRRARLGDAAKIAAKAQMIAARQLPPPEDHWRIE